MRSPIEILIDSCGMKCCKCGADAGKCDCWTECSCGWSAEKGQPCNNPATTRCSTKLKFGLVIECPKCGKKKTVAADKSDPKGTARIVAKCPKCSGDFEEVRYFDKRGKELTP